MKELVDSQTRNIERAFTMDNGPFDVAPLYAQKKENPKKWVQQSEAHKERVLSSIHRIPTLQAPEQAPCTVRSSGMQTKSENVSPLSVSWRDIGLSGEVFSGM